MAIARSFKLFLAACGLAILAGCGGLASRDNTAATTAPTLSPIQYAYVVDNGLPSETSGQSYLSQSDTLFQAEQRLRESCMRRAGFRYIRDPEPTTGALPTTFAPQPDGQPPREAGLLTRRAKRGFGLYVRATAAPQPAIDPDPDDRYLMTLPPSRQARWLQAWWGGGGGCLQTVQTELYGSRANAVADIQVPNLIHNFLLMHAQSDPRVTAVTAKWSTCMLRATGRRWANESSLIEAFAAHPPTVQRTRAFRATEISDAMAAARCGYSTGQAWVYARAFVLEANHLPRDLERRLRSALAVRADAVLRARQVLAR